MRAGEHRRYEIPSRLLELAPLRASVRTLASEHGFGRQALDDLELCVHEAVSNAMVHGHGLDPVLKVVVIFEAVGEGLRVTVRDQGPGFDPATVARPAAPPGEEARGRGLQIISRLCTSQEWLDGGRTLVFVKAP
ncbi:MAG TPA: ATP-binding protein [Armatimonadetes bacterium]|nr:ATP-binding protein [Armatimonadota bacterium]